MKSSAIGGQAVIEGVMMKNRDEYAVAVRKPDKSIEVKNETYISIQKKYPFMKLPIIRGMVSFVESMVIGMKTLTYSASFYEEEEVKQTKMEEKLSKVFKEKAESVVMGATVLFSIVLAVAIFMILPFFIAEFFKKIINNTTIIALVEGLIRITIFIAYVVLISFVKDLKRVFMYHGAEHKTINSVEHALTVENVKKQSKSHKRCGTSFLFIVMFISVVFFLFIRMDNVWIRMLFRILLVPVIAGVSYEFIRLAGNSDSSIINILSKPGLWLQALTTREPDDSMIEVAIASVEAVFDWKKFQEEVKSEVLYKQQAKEEKPVVARQTVKKTQDESKLENETNIELAATKENATKENKSLEPYHIVPGVLDEEEDDEILNALDKYFIFEDEKKEP